MTKKITATERISYNEKWIGLTWLFMIFMLSDSLGESSVGLLCFTLFTLGIGREKLTKKNENN